MSIKLQNNFEIGEATFNPNPWKSSIVSMHSGDSSLSFKCWPHFHELCKHEMSVHRKSSSTESDNVIKQKRLKIHWQNTNDPSAKFLKTSRRFIWFNYCPCDTNTLHYTSKHKHWFDLGIFFSCCFWKWGFLSVTPHFKGIRVL